MSRRAVVSLLTTAVLCLSISNSFANDGGMLSNAAVSNAGLRVQWFTQIATGVRGKVVDLHLNVNENKSTTFFEVIFGKQREVISQHDFDAFGNPRGIEGAQEFAELRKEIIGKELEAKGIDPSIIKIQQYTLPRTTMYALTTDGYVVAIDGDTGKTRWATVIGENRFPSIGLGSNNQYVAAVNGASLYLLNAENGKVLFRRKCVGAPSSGPAISDLNIFVPLSNGRVEVFSIGAKGVGSQRFVGSGRALNRPLITEKSMSWATTAGHLNVALHKRPTRKWAPKPTENPDEPPREKTAKEIAIEKSRDAVNKRIEAMDTAGSITYRVRADDQFVSAATFKSGMFFIASLSGFVYAIDEDRGIILWEFSTGEQIEASPIPIGNDLYVVTTENSLYKLDSQTGAHSEGWDKPVRGISEYVSASKDKIFAKDSVGNLVVLSQDNGQRLGQVYARGFDLVYQNEQSDRLYLGNKKGLIQCLREVSSSIPYFHSAEFVKAMETKPSEDADEGDMMEKAEESDDPFAGVDFGDDSSSDDDGDNPFGGGSSDDSSDDSDDNPFGGSSDDTPTSDDNPFGGGTP